MSQPHPDDEDPGDLAQAATHAGIASCPTATLHDLDPDTGTTMVNGQLACQCCGDREASIHEASASFCPTCYEAGAARDDRDQS